MPTFPGNTGDVVTSAMWNGLPAFTVQTAKIVDYTAASGDEYQQLIPMNKATAIAFKIPTDATYNFAVGTVITVLASVIGRRGICSRPFIGGWRATSFSRNAWKISTKS
jgi:hypothetical protein